MKKTFIFYTDWKDYTEEMTLEEKWLFLQTILLYQDWKEVWDISSIKFIRSKIKKQLDEDKEKWEQKVDKLSEAGKKWNEKRRWKTRKKATKSQSIANATTTSLVVADNVNENVNVFNLKIKWIKDIFLTEWYLESDLDREATVCFEHYKWKRNDKIPSTQYNNRIKKSIQYWNLTKPKKKMEYATLDDE